MLELVAVVDSIGGWHHSSVRSGTRCRSALDTASLSWVLGQRVYPDESSGHPMLVAEGACSTPAGTMEYATRRTVPQLGALFDFLIAKRAFLREVRCAANIGSQIVSRVALSGLNRVMARLSKRRKSKLSKGLCHWLQADLYLRAACFGRAIEASREAQHYWSAADNSLGVAHALTLEGDATAQSVAGSTWNVPPARAARKFRSANALSLSPISSTCATNYVQARAIYRRAATLFQRSGQRSSRARVLIRRAGLEAAAGNQSEVGELAQEALSLAEQAKAPLTAALIDYAVIMATGRLDHARRKSMLQVARLARANGQHAFVTGLALTFRSAAMQQFPGEVGDPRTVRFAAAEVLERGLDDHHAQMTTLIAWADVERAGGRKARARALFVRALKASERASRKASDNGCGVAIHDRRKQHQWIERQLG